jgi:hypothetical protein
MLRTVLAAAVLALAPQSASLTGEWSATVMAPRGVLEYTMYLNQEGPRLTGYFQSQYGEIPLKGTIDGGRIKLTWTMMDGSREVSVTMSGTVKEDTITGTATLGTIGEGAFRAERSGSQETVCLRRSSRR